MVIETKDTERRWESAEDDMTKAGVKTETAVSLVMIDLLWTQQWPMMEQRAQLKLLWSITDQQKWK